MPRKCCGGRRFFPRRLSRCEQFSEKWPMHCSLQASASGPSGFCLWVPDSASRIFPRPCEPFSIAKVSPAFRICFPGGCTFRSQTAILSRTRRGESGGQVSHRVRRDNRAETSRRGRCFYAAIGLHIMQRKAALRTGSASVNAADSTYACYILH